MAFRIEITFSGDAPEVELARAKILADPGVMAAMSAFSECLDSAGLRHTVAAHTIRTQEGRRKPRLAQQAASE